MPSALELKYEELHIVKSGQFEIGTLLETDDYVFIHGVYDRLLHRLIYKKNENQTIGCEISLLNNLDGGSNFWPFYKFEDNKTGASLFPYQIKKYLDREVAEIQSGYDFYDDYRPKLDYDVEKHKKLLEQLEKTDDMSNPVLMIVTMKSSFNHEN